MVTDNRGSEDAPFLFALISNYAYTEFVLMLEKPG